MFVVCSYGGAGRGWGSSIIKRTVCWERHRPGETFPTNKPPEILFRGNQLYSGCLLLLYKLYIVHTSTLIHLRTFSLSFWHRSLINHGDSESPEAVLIYITCLDSCISSRQYWNECSSNDASVAVEIWCREDKERQNMSSTWKWQEEQTIIFSFH